MNPPAPDMDAPDIDAVVIGRNEGDRLLACLTSLQGQVARLIYVDSGSTDNSVATAQALGAEVVQLDMSLPFTAARARNAGLALAQATFVQFVDGDCVVDADWLSTAQTFLQDHNDVAVVCGRRREMHPDASVYNRLCDMEWDTPIGQALACGGDALMRRDALTAVDGYRDSLIAGEEPELCVRLRKAGWKIWRIEAEMTRHDANITRLSQWWKRSRRAGHAYAEGAYLHGAAPEHHWVRETRRALVWGYALPLVTLFGMTMKPWMVVFVLAYPAQIARLSTKGGWTWAFFTVLGKFPEALGVLQYRIARLRGKYSKLVEYK